MLSSNLVCVPTKITCEMLAIFLLACGKHDTIQASNQVADRVVRTEISLLQINQLLKNEGNVAPENAFIVRKEILDKLIDQQDIVKKAINDNLDRSPEVKVSIEAAKKDILAKANLQKAFSNNVKITNQDVKDYYAEHPIALKTTHLQYTICSTLENDHVSTAINEAFVKQISAQEVTDLLNTQIITATKETHA